MISAEKHCSEVCFFWHFENQKQCAICVYYIEEKAVISIADIFKTLKLKQRFVSG